MKTSAQVRKLNSMAEITSSDVNHSENREDFFEIRFSQFL